MCSTRLCLVWLKKTSKCFSIAHDLRPLAPTLRASNHLKSCTVISVCTDVCSVCRYGTFRGITFIKHKEDRTFKMVVKELRVLVSFHVYLQTVFSLFSLSASEIKFYSFSCQSTIPLSVCRHPVRSLHSILKSVLQWMKAPLPSCLFKLLLSWNKCGRIWSPAGCARHGRRVSWRAQQPNSPSLSGKCSEGSALDRAAEIQMTIYPTLPCCFFLQRRKNMKPGVNFSSAATKLKKTKQNKNNDTRSDATVNASFLQKSFDIMGYRWVLHVPPLKYFYIHDPKKNLYAFDQK